MIDLSDVRIETHKTYFFLPASIAVDFSNKMFEYHIQNQGYETLDLLNNNIPEVQHLTWDEMVAKLRPYQKAGYDEPIPYLIVSHANTEDLFQKSLQMCIEPIDSDYKQEKIQSAKRSDIINQDGYITDAPY